MGYLILDGFTAPSGTSSICEIDLKKKEKKQINKTHHIMPMIYMKWGDDGFISACDG